MRDKIRQFANGQFHKKSPKISISPERLSIQMEQEKDYHGSFLVTSTNDIEMKGFLQITNPVLRLETMELHGRSQQVDFYIRKEEYMPYEEQEGEIQILTNGGEFFLPFTIGVRGDDAVSSELGTIQDLYQFANMAKVNQDKALEIFCSPYFSNVLLRGRQEALFLYRQLCKGSSGKLAMEEFLKALGQGRKGSGRESLDSEGRKDPPAVKTVDAVDHRREEKTKNPRYQKKLIQKSIMEVYLAYRTNHIELGEYIEKTLDLIQQYEQLDNLPLLYYLLRLHMYVLSENHIMYVAELPLCQEKCSLLSRVSEENCYLQYIEALYSMDERKIRETVAGLKAVIKAHPGKAAPFLMLIYLDAEYADNLELQFRTIKKYFEQGLNTPLFYFEACDLLNRNQDLLKELGSFELLLLNWGYRYQYLSMEVIDRFAHLSLKEKSFAPRIFHLLEKFYAQDPKLEYLTAICAHIIKGNQLQKKYHHYLKKGVESNLKLIGIQEYYIRTLDREDFEILPRELLQYFLHSGNLNAGEKAYYYANLVVNRIYYGDMYQAYLHRIDAFMFESIQKGRMSPLLEVLYRERLAAIEITEEIACALPDVLFKKKVECHDPAMEGVIVHHMEEKKGSFYEFKDGIAYIDVYTGHPLILYADKDRRRYVDCGQSITPVFDVEPYIDRLLQFRKRNPKLLLFYYSRARDENQADEKYMSVARDLIKVDTMTDEFRIQVLRQVIGFYYDSSDGDMLDEYLRQIRLSLLTGRDRGSIIELLIKRRLYSQAADAIETYGIHYIGGGALLNLGQYLVKNDQADTRELAVNVCEQAFERGRYDRTTVEYLARYYVAAVKTLLPVWETAGELGLDRTELEDTILALALFSENIDHIYPVFQSFAEKKDSSVLAEAYLQYASYQYMMGKQTLPEEFFEQLHGAIRRNMAKGPFARMALLKDYSRRIGSLEEDQIKMARRLLELSINENMILPYFQSFHEIIPLPAEVMMKTVVAYYSDEGRDIMLHYNIAANHRAEEQFAGEYMREILPGLYTREFMLFSDEQLFYYITQDNVTKVELTRVDGTDGNMDKTDGRETRFDMLNHMLMLHACRREEEAAALGEQYCRQMYLIRDQVRIL